MIRFDPREGNGQLLVVFGRGTITLQALYHPDQPIARLEIRDLRVPGEIGKKHEFRPEEFSKTPSVNLQFSTVSAIDHLIRKLEELRRDFKDKYGRSQAQEISDDVQRGDDSKEV